MNRPVRNRGAALGLAAAIGGLAGIAAAGASRPEGATGRQAPPPETAKAPATHVLLPPERIRWQPGPNALPRGAEIALLEGDPMRSGPFTMRLKMPPGYRIPPHSHPADEHVSVISGEFHLGMGERFDATAGTALAAGGFALLPRGMRHFAWTTDTETVIQLHGTGPWGIVYVDPKDDPRRQAGAEPPVTR